MNKTNNNYAKEMYVSPKAMTVEMDITSVLCSSDGYGTDATQAGSSRSINRYQNDF